MARTSLFATIIGVAFSSALSGCASGSVQTIDSMPLGATVTIDGFGQCETPCTVKVDRPRIFTIAKAGYRAQRHEIKPGRDLTIIMELAAPSGDVDAAPLPDLN